MMEGKLYPTGAARARKPARGFFFRPRPQPRGCTLLFLQRTPGISLRAGADRAWIAGDEQAAPSRLWRVPGHQPSWGMSPAAGQLEVLRIHRSRPDGFDDASDLVMGYWARAVEDSHPAGGRPGHQVDRAKLVERLDNVLRQEAGPGQGGDGGNSRAS